MSFFNLRDWNISSLLILLLTLIHFGFGSKKQTDLNGSDTSVAGENTQPAAPAAPAFNCEQLQVGDSRLVVASDQASPTGTHYLYKLTRLGDKDFEVVLNLKYTTAVGASNNAINAQFHQRAAYCFSRADQALLGPNGEHMHIRLSSKTEPNPVPPEHAIAVMQGAGNGFRGDADNFNANTFDCPTILHESLHLMGLVDEYQEAHIGLVLDSSDPSGKSWRSDTGSPGFNCRTLGSSDSVMRDMRSAWSRSFSGGLYAMECTCDSDECSEAFSHSPDLTATQCPNHSRGGGHALTIKEEESATPGIISSDATHYSAILNTLRFTGASLLKPAHFYSITQPGCEINKPFYQCALNAYRTTKDRLGEGCVATPNFCRDNTTNWTDETTGN